MKRIGLAILGLALAVALPARADQWSKTYNITGKPDLRVDTSDANVHVYGWDQNILQARVTTERYKIGEGGIRIVEHQSGDSVELELHFPHEVCFMCFNWKSRRVDIEIHMPRDGRVNLRTGDGRIELSDFRGEMELRSGDGSQEVSNVDGRLRARAGDGHIRANGRFDALDVNTGDGRIEVNAQNGSAVAGSWTLQAGDGSVTLRIPDKLAAALDLHTSDGHITLDMPVEVEGKLAEHNIRGKLNGGGNLLSIHTGDGSIRLGRT